MVFSRSEVYLNSKAIEHVGLDKTNQPWLKRDAGGRPTGIVDIAGANAVRNAAKFLDAPNGGRANLPMDVIVASQMAMLHDLNKSGLTASGGDCTFEDLYRQIQSQGKTFMRFFCFRTAPAGGRGATALDQQIAALPRLNNVHGDNSQEHAHRGELIANN